MSKLVLSVIHVDGTQQFLCSFFVIHKLSLWNSTGVKNPVSVGGIIGLSVRPNIMKYLNLKLYLPLLEIPVEDSARKAFPTDPDALQHAVAA